MGSVFTLDGTNSYDSDGTELTEWFQLVLWCNLKMEITNNDGLTDLSQITVLMMRQELNLPM